MSADQLPALPVSVVTLLFAMPFLFDAIKRSAALSLERGDYRIWTGLTLFTLLGQLMQLTLPGGIVIHYLCAAFLTTAIGYCRALVSLTVIFALIHPWSLLGLEILVNAILPCWLMHSLILATRRYLPPNPFVFLLGCGFFGAYAVSTLQLLANSGLESLIGAQSSHHGWSTVLGYKLLLLSGEVIVEGMILTMLVVYLPRAVTMFDDEFYLRRR